MYYILITIAIIACSTFFVYVLANKVLSIPIRLKSLVICAVCAIVINIVIPRVVVGFAGVTGTLFFLIFIAILVAYIIAYYFDDRDNNDDEFIEGNLQSDSAIPIFNNSSQGIVNGLGNDKLFTSNVVENAETKENNEQIAVEQTIVEETVASQTECIDATAEQVVDEAQRTIVQTIVEDNNNTAENIMENECQDAVLEQNIELTAAPDISVTAVEDKKDIYPDSSDLDILTDFAYEQKEGLNYILALKAFRQALELYPDSEAVPFLVMEIAGILKHAGLYEDAIKTFENAKQLNAIKNNPVFDQEFTNTIAYLNCVIKVLVGYNMPGIKFNDIPKLLLNEVDAEFRKWRDQA